eukprot:7158707-Prorocentrum_lima.AAC.1
MTSSLVGSEMCIRDRFSDMLDQRHTCGNMSKPNVDAVPLKYRRVVQTAPVSYTHLTLPTICSV